MQAQQSVGLDLPLKALVFEDAAGTTWIAYHDPHQLADLYGLGSETAGVIDAMAATLAAVANEATASA